MAEDFEEEVWSYGVETREDSSSPNIRKAKDLSTKSSCPSWGQSGAPRLIPKVSNQVKRQEILKMSRQSSAPVNIPDWSKIYGKSGNSRNVSCVDHHDDDGGGCHGDDDDGDGDDDEGMLPPHEWLSKRLARSRISSFSMCEGIGRTLKGRDLSRVRNAILTKTGFIE